MKITKIRSSIIILFSLLLLVSCKGSSDDDNSCAGRAVPETFDESNRPGIEYDVAGDFFLVKPWNYEKDYNASRRYPLLIYMHGGSQAKYLKNLFYMGMGYYNWSDDVQNMTEEYRKDIADEFRKTYPCFMYVPQGYDGFDIEAIIAQIEKFKTDYRIDSNRIYVHGFSMGGGGAYSLANAYYSYNGQLLAGIIRLSGGGSLSSVEIAEKTSIWVMVGLNDSQGLIDHTRNSYSYLQNLEINAGAAETDSGEYVIGTSPNTHRARTWTLTKNGWDFAKRTEFADDGHFTTQYPFEDPAVFAWLFDKSLECR